MAPKEKVMSLVDRSRNAKHWSVEDMLKDALAEVQEGKRIATKAVVLFLNDADGKYHTGFHQAGMTLSQIIALMEINRAIFIEDILHADPC